MSESIRFSDVTVGWGPAERAAVDLCLFEPSRFRPPSIPARIGVLARTIETEIIPRLLLAHREESTEDAGKPMRPGHAETAELASAAMADEGGAASCYIDAMLARGISREDVLLNLLAPAARLLGDMWREDLCTFADVTIGLSRLQAVVRGISEQDEVASDSVGGRILLAPVPGDQHTFGVSILEGFFRRAGWDVEEGIGFTGRELAALVGSMHFDIVGLSLSCEVLFDRTAPLIRMLRKASLNPSLLVMVGGRLFVDDPARSTEAGADLVAFDATDALRRARSCLGVSARC